MRILFLIIAFLFSLSALADSNRGGLRKYESVENNGSHSFFQTRNNVKTETLGLYSQSFLLRGTELAESTIYGRLTLLDLVVPSTGDFIKLTNAFGHRGAIGLDPLANGFAVNFSSKYNLNLYIESEGAQIGTNSFSFRRSGRTEAASTEILNISETGNMAGPSFIAGTFNATLDLTASNCSGGASTVPGRWQRSGNIVSVCFTSSTDIVCTGNGTTDSSISTASGVLPTSAWPTSTAYATTAVHDGTGNIVFGRMFVNTSGAIGATVYGTSFIGSGSRGFVHTCISYPVGNL